MINCHAREDGRLLYFWIPAEVYLREGGGENDALGI